MAKVVRREVRKRGILGWFFLIVFLAFNAFMALWLWGTFQVGMTAPEGQALRDGAPLITGVAATFVLGIWFLGAVVTGLLALITRGGKTVITEEVG